MSLVGGDLIDATYNHPTVGSGTLFFKSNEDATIIQGGFATNDDANQITGSGTLIVQKNRRAGSIELPPIAWDMTDINELDKLQQMSNSSLLADWTFTHVSGAIFGGKGVLVGDIAGSTNTATISGAKINFENNGPKRIS